MKTLTEQEKEDMKLRVICSDCGLCSGDKKPIECFLGSPRSTLEDYQTEYRLYDRAIVTETDIIENDRIISLRDHRHALALTLVYPLEHGFVIRKKICSVCRETYETWIYRDLEENERLTQKLKRRV
jgi:hypothetical protein